MGTCPQLHDGSLAELALDLPHGGVNRLDLSGEMVMQSSRMGNRVYGS